MDISILIPCYNEEPHLAKSIDVLSKTMKNCKWSYEFILVDDCSPDNTRQVIEAVCDEHEHCRSIYHEHNRGRGAAVKTGFAAAHGTAVGFIDIDLEVGAHYVPVMVQHILEQGYDVATGHRYYLMRQTGGLLRVALSYGYKNLCRALLRSNIKDSETGYKFFRKATTTDVVMGSTCDGWFWDTEVMSRAVLADLRIIELPVLYLRRFDKKSTVHLFRDSIDYLLQLRTFRQDVGLSLFKRSPVYWSCGIYDITMKLLMGSAYDDYCAALAAYIEPGSSVVDLCAGSARLERHLRDKNCEYLALDFNSTFVMGTRNRGIRARFHNVLSDSIPDADYVVMSASMYHFNAHPDVLPRMCSAARRAVVIAEPVHNISNHAFKPLAKFCNWLTNPGVGDYQFRYSPEEFRAFCEQHDATEIRCDDHEPFAYGVFKGTPDVDANPIAPAK